MRLFTPKPWTALWFAIASTRDSLAPVWPRPISTFTGNSRSNLVSILPKSRDFPLTLRRHSFSGDSPRIGFLRLLQSGSDIILIPDGHRKVDKNVRIDNYAVLGRRDTSSNRWPEYEIEAKTSLTDRALRTIKHAEAFAVDSHDDLGTRRDAAEGLYFHDSRYLSHFELRLEILSFRAYSSDVCRRFSPFAALYS
jgi:hypothetical protein